MRVDALVKKINARRVQFCLVILGAEETIDEKSAVGRRRIGTHERNLRGSIEFTSADVSTSKIVGKKVKRRGCATDQIAPRLDVAGGRADVDIPSVDVEPRNIGAELDADEGLVDLLRA